MEREQNGIKSRLLIVKLYKIRAWVNYIYPKYTFERKLAKAISSTKGFTKALDIDKKLKTIKKICLKLTLVDIKMST